jgi:hypothetical protein
MNTSCDDYDLSYIFFHCTWRIFAQCPHLILGWAFLAKSVHRLLIEVKSTMFFCAFWIHELIDSFFQRRRWNNQMNNIRERINIIEWYTWKMRERESCYENTESVHSKKKKKKKKKRERESQWLLSTSEQTLKWVSAFFITLGRSKMANPSISRWLA